MSLKERLVEFLINNPQELKTIYKEFNEEKPSTIRGRLNENINKSFKRIGKGIYLAINGESKALIIEGDAWEVLKDFDANSVDAIITDSGYTCLNKHYEVGSTRQRNLNKSIGFNTKDIDKPLLREMHRILKQGGHFFSFLPADAKDSLDYNNNFIATAMSEGFEFNKRFIWSKETMGMGYNGRAAYEQIVFLSKGKRRMPFDLAIKDLLKHKAVHSTKRTHDAEKPVELIKDLVRFSTKEGEVVLDPFAGSMATSKACTELNRHSICIDNDSEVIKKVVGVEYDST